VEKWSEREWGKPGIELDERSTVSGCEVLFGVIGLSFYRAMHFSAKRGIAIACRLSVRLSVCVSVCDVGEL